MINDYITLELTDLDGNVVYFCENKFIVLTAKKILMVVVVVL